MTDRGDRGMWVAALLLSGAALGIGWMAWAAPDELACRLPANPQAMRSLAFADEVGPKTGGKRGGIVLWYQALWKPDRSDGARSLAQLVVSEDRSDFVVPPFWMVPNFPLPSDAVDQRDVAVGETTVPVHLRMTRREGVSPFVLGWTYAFEDEPVTNPVAHVLRRAFRHPFAAAPPLTMISVDSQHGAIGPERRTSAVLSRLSMIWREWEALCRP